MYKWIMLAATFWLTTAVAAETVTMPPRFTTEMDAGTLLRAYPLGTISKQAAFSHHGKANRTVKLPNGMEGWVYEIGGGAQARTYTEPSGEQQQVEEKNGGFGLRTYTLEFDDRGMVIDVLYHEHGRHDGLTALQSQYTADMALGAAKAP